jgi:hypothetical protein
MFQYKTFIGNTSNIGPYTHSIVKKYLKIYNRYPILKSTSWDFLIGLSDNNIKFIWLPHYCFMDYGNYYGLK